jgi:rieske iron-sulfur protein
MPDVASASEEKEHVADMPGAHRTRRALLVTALAGCACLAAGLTASADDDQPGSDERPKKDDLLVASEGAASGQVIKPSDLTQGGPPVHAWPKDPRTSVVRNASRLNEIILIKLDPTELDDDTRSRAVEGILAYSAICSHAGCPVTDWVKGEGNGKTVLKCPCHNSEYDPRASAQVVFGPAPRRLAALPLALSNDSLTIAGPFAGKVGGTQ